MGWLGRCRGRVYKALNQKKNGWRKISFSSARFSFWFELELQLQCELNLSGRAEIARGEASRGDLPERCAGWRERESRVSKVRVIEDVKHLRPELQIGSLGEFRVFNHREVGIYEVRTRDGVAA